jgi:hypothetical protein
MQSTATNCFACVAEHILFDTKHAMGQLGPSAIRPDIEEAVTWAPSWQKQEIMGQMVMACVTLPTCRRHMSVTEMSPAERAIQGGRLLQGHVGN